MQPAVTHAFFEEKQFFRQTWIWVALIPISLMGLLLLAVAFYQQLYLGKPFGNNPTSDQGLLMIAVFLIPLLIGLPIGFYKINLLLRLESDNLHVRFFPFVNKHILLREIVRCEPRTYNPLMEFGGWGIRYGGKKRGWAYNVSGNRGVQLELANGKLLLIGSQRAEELAAAIKQIRAV